MKHPKRIVKDMVSKHNGSGNYPGSQYNINYVDELAPKKKRNIVISQQG